MDFTIRLCLDTSALLVGIGAPDSDAARILRAALDDRLTLVTSRQIEEEWATAFLRPSAGLFLENRRIFPQTYLNLVADIRLVSELVQPSGEPPPRRDERDRMYLHCAQHAAVPFIVSLDNDLLEAPNVPGTEILTPEAFVSRMTVAGLFL